MQKKFSPEGMKDNRIRCVSFNPGLWNPQLHRFSNANSPSTTENHDETETGHQK